MSTIKALIRRLFPKRREVFSIITPDAVYEWRPLADITPMEAANFALFLHRGNESTIEDLAGIARHLVKVDK